MRTAIAQPLDAALLGRIEAFDIDGDRPSLPFTARLARENGWSQTFSTRVVAEYKRFVYLAMVAGHPVTPSDQVDQAWHLHLTYTRSYWERFCGAVLPRPLHHSPTRGGAVENRKFDRWYERTLASYRELFGAEPPPDIWPPARIRFGVDLAFERINLARNLVISRRTAHALLALSGGVLMLVGCSGEDGYSGYVVLAVVLILVLALLLRGSGFGGGCSNDSGGCGGCDGGGCGGD